MYRRIMMLVLSTVLCTGLAKAADMFEVGRTLPTERDDVFSLGFGGAFNVNTLVQDPGAGDGSMDYLEMSGPGPAFGLNYEYNAWIVSFMLEGVFTSISGDQTANDRLYLELSDGIGYNGASYDYMYIPEGAPFETSFMGGTLDMNLLLHPVVWNVTDAFSVIPLIEGGVLLFGGEQTIDAGEASGTMNSPNQGRDYVVGGESSGLIGFAAPQWGPGCEVRIGADDAVNHVIKFHWLFFGLDDTDHTNLKLSYRMEFPLETYDNTLFFGVDAKTFETQGQKDVEGGGTADHYNLAMSSVMFTFGITY